MLGRDIVGRLWENLPRHTPHFTKNVGIASVAMTGGTVTITTDAPHGLIKYANVVGVSVPVEIASVTENAESLTIVTVTDHDLTKNNKENIVVEAVITGTVNETFIVISVENRREFRVAKGAGIPAAGDFLQEQFISGYNGIKTITSVPTPDSFTYEIEQNLAVPNLAAGTVSGGHRISGAVTFDVAKAAYTKQGDNDFWAFVVIDDTSANKDRRGVNDSVSQRGTRQSFFSMIIEQFSIFLFIPNKGDTLQDVGGLIARDKAVEQRLPIFKSILGTKFSSNLSFQGQSSCTYVADGFYLYEGPYYVHQYIFQQVSNVTNPDTSVESDDHAFRDIDFTFEGLGIQETDTDMTAHVDLDDFPLSG